MISKYRYITVGVLCAVVLSLFVLRLYNLQFIHGDEYLTPAQESSRKVIRLTGARGKMISIYFRDPDGNLVEVSRYPED